MNGLGIQDIDDDLSGRSGRADDTAPRLATASESGTSRQPWGRLGTILLITDVVAATAGWAAGLGLGALVGGTPVHATMAWAVPASLMCLLLIRAQKLYLSRVCSVRATELRGLSRASVYTGVAAFVGGRALPGVDIPPVLLVAGAVTCLLSLVVGRTAYRSWLSAHRRAGRYTRPVVMIGSNDDAAELFQVTHDHPEIGFSVVGVVVTPGQRVPFDSPVLGTVTDVATTMRSMRATGAIVVATALAPQTLNEVVRELMRLGVHIHLSSGLRGIAHQRMRTVPFSHEPMLYLEQPRLSHAQQAAKRALDLFVGAATALVALPVFALVCVAIRLEDGGPILFRQQRVGKDGNTFTVYKLRTMVIDAEAKLAALQALNQRGQGPLFKLSRDPRVTRIGRFLRATSIDELPQLINVLNGTMSLVGPRPALPSEVEQFDAQLQTRTRVQPGITGLWQVEARDNPAFGPYRRLDLFYVDNWSIGLDLTILATTAAAVLGRGVRTLAPVWHRIVGAPAEAAHVSVLE